MKTKHTFFSYHPCNEGKRGFTLIELMVVISIISMLASVVLATIRPMRAQARDAVRKQEVHQMDMAIQQYISDNGHPPEWEGCELQTSILDPNLVSGCMAVSTSGVDASGNPTGTGNPAWTHFTNAIKPYMHNVPADPCGINCTTPNGTPPGYTYLPPAVVYFYSGSPNSNYQLSAALENGSNTSGVTGGQISIPNQLELELTATIVSVDNTTEHLGHSFQLEYYVVGYYQEPAVNCGMLTTSSNAAGTSPVWSLPNSADRTDVIFYPELLKLNEIITITMTCTVPTVSGVTTSKTVTITSPD